MMQLKFLILGADRAIRFSYDRYELFLYCGFLCIEEITWFLVCYWWQRAIGGIRDH
jgi:hypothetical protein